MAGLLDILGGNFGTDDPRQAAYLALASGLLSGRGNFGQVAGQALQGAQGTFQEARKAQQQAMMTKMQMEEMQRRAKEAQEVQAQQARDAELLKAQYTPLPGPTETGGPLLPRFDPASMIAGGGSMGAVSNAAQLHALMNPQRKTVARKPGDVIFDENDPTKPLYTVPDKTDKGTSDMQEFEFAMKRGEVPAGQTFTDWMRANKRAGASNVSVSTGQKGYENESKLRNDFKSEPIYKDYSDMLTAHKQIKVGIAQANPVGDLATATKIMKLLDPTSVVRESELAMAMAASGRMDRLKNFVELQIQGHKLTATQRQEFGVLADELMEATGQAYNAKRAEYVKFGKSYGLSEGVLGDPYKQRNDGKAPEGVDPKVWQFMTPEQKKLWQN